jgi:endonuclease/exonuclease/phosphatase (EEP) superfamily protein YafD
MLLCWSYTLLIVLWLVLRIWVFDRLWWVALLNTLALYLFVPLVVLIPLALWRHRWPALLALALPIAGFISIIGVALLPRSAAPPPTPGPTITVMSFNLLARNRDIAAITAAIQANAPDLVGVQELTAETETKLAQALLPTYPYHVRLPADLRAGVGLFSRHPLEDLLAYPLPPMHLSLRGRVRIDDRALQIYVVHLSPNNMLGYPLREFPTLTAARYAARAAETTQLQQALQTSELPTMVLCDCNLTETSEDYVRLQQAATDSFREASWGFGHTLRVGQFPLPVQRIDYIWHTAGVVAVEAWVGPDGGSDHLPVSAKLQLLR